MKKPKRINSKRPSLWMPKSGIFLVVYYPSGKALFYSVFFGGWRESCLSDEIPKRAIQDLKKDHTFLGYL